MKDAGFALETAYYALLSALSYQGLPLRIYAGMADDEAAAPLRHYRRMDQPARQHQDGRSAKKENWCST